MTSRSIPLLHCGNYYEQYLMGMDEKAQNLGHLPPPCTGPLCFQVLTSSARGRLEADLEIDT